MTILSVALISIRRFGSSFRRSDLHPSLRLFFPSL
ncbi:hypothetical protein LSPCS325_52920 [Lysinibacillus sp. CTST325]